MGVGGIFDEMMDWKAALERNIKMDCFTFKSCRRQFSEKYFIEKSLQ